MRRVAAQFAKTPETMEEYLRARIETLEGEVKRLRAKISNLKA